MATEVAGKAAKKRKLDHNSTEAGVGLPDISLMSPVVFLSDTRQAQELYGFRMPLTLRSGIESTSTAIV